MPNLPNFIVHIKDVDTNEHLVEPVSVCDFSVDFHQAFNEVSTITGENFRIPGFRTGHIKMQARLTDINLFSALWQYNIRQANIECSNGQGIHHEYYRCALSSMQHMTEFSSGLELVELEWKFFANPTSGIGRLAAPAISRRMSKPEPKLDWRESGF